jgi:hypothetical protein
MLLVLAMWKAFPLRIRPPVALRAAVSEEKQNSDRRREHVLVKAVEVLIVEVLVETAMLQVLLKAAPFLGAARLLAAALLQGMQPLGANPWEHQVETNPQQPEANLRVHPKQSPKLTQAQLQRP